MRILVVEDEPRIAADIRSGLEGANYAVDLARDGEDAWFKGETEDYDAIVLDLGLPRLDGLSVLRRLRGAGVTIPVLILTARDGWTDKVDGFKAGADDYLTKPFAPKELSARIRALLRRVRPISAGHAHLTFGDLEIVPDEGKVLRAGTELHLTKTEFKLLCELAQNPGRVFSRESLLDKVWGYDYFGDGRLVDVHVRRLRMKVEHDPANPRHVLTVRGLGYRLQS
jgi:DNA-binding response OmpR family regulator